MRRSVSTLSAMPWYVTPRSMRTPSAPIFRGAGVVERAPAPGEPVAAAGHDPLGGARVAHRGFERPDERPEHEPAVGEPDDRVRDELAGPVVRHLPAPLDADDLDAEAAERPSVGADVGGVGVTAEREDRVVLEEDELVADEAGGSRTDDAVLEVPGIAVCHPPEPARAEGSGRGRGLGRTGLLDRREGPGPVGGAIGLERRHEGTIAPVR